MRCTTSRGTRTHAHARGRVSTRARARAPESRTLSLTRGLALALALLLALLLALALPLLTPASVSAPAGTRANITLQLAMPCSLACMLRIVNHAFQLCFLHVVPYPYVHQSTAMSLDKLPNIPIRCYIRHVPSKLRLGGDAGAPTRSRTSAQPWPWRLPIQAPGRLGCGRDNWLYVICCGSPYAPIATILPAAPPVFCWLCSPSFSLSLLLLCASHLMLSVVLDFHACKYRLSIRALAELFWTMHSRPAIVASSQLH